MSDLGVDMYCPICSGEYRDGIETCPTCDVPLTADRPHHEREPRTDRLPTAATLAMIGTGLIFLIRTVATINPSTSLAAARVSTILYLVSYAAIIYFFVVFARDAVDRSQWRLKLAIYAVLAGSLTAASIVAMNLLLLFNRPVVSGHPLGVASAITSMLLPVTSVLFFACFLADHRSVSARLSTAARFALAGALLSASAHGVAAVLVGRAPVILAQVHPLLLLLGIPIVVFAVGTWLYFLWVIRTDLPP
jgi:hypothetical protein